MPRIKVMQVLFLVLGVLGATAVAAQTFPAPPAATVNTAPPDTTSYVTRTVCASGCDFTTLQEAITAIDANQRTNGVIIELGSGFVNNFSSEYALPSHIMSAGKKIIVRGPHCPTANSGNLSTDFSTMGVRMTASFAQFANVPILRAIAPLTTHIIHPAANAKSYRFQCLRAETDINLTALFEIHNAAPNMPSDFIFDRIYTNANGSATLIRPLVMNCDNCAVVDSSILGGRHTANETQAVALWRANGPQKYANNHMQGSGMSFIAGGASAGTTNMIPSDFQFLGNLLDIPDNWCTGAGGGIYVCKNRWEAKNLQRWLFKGNYVNKSWCCTQREMIVLTPKSSGTDPWTVTQDGEFIYNKFIGAPNGISMSSLIGGEPSTPARRLWFHHNTIENISGSAWGGVGADGDVFRIACGGDSETQAERANNIIIEHNTGFGSRSWHGFYNSSPTATPHACDWIVNRYNVFGIHTNPEGIYGQDGGFQGESVINNYTIVAQRDFQKSVLPGRNLSQYDQFYTSAYLPSNFSAVGMVGWVSGLTCGGDCSLSLTSPYAAGQASECNGLDCGADVAEVENWTCGAQSGTWTCFAGGASAPTVTSLNITTGPTAGGTAVTITGTNFVSGATVDLGGNAATSVVVVGATSITCVTPAHAAGAVAVTVTNPDMQSGSLSNAFTFVAPTPGVPPGVPMPPLTEVVFRASAPPAIQISNPDPVNHPFCASSAANDCIFEARLYANGSLVLAVPASLFASGVASIPMPGTPRYGDVIYTARFAARSPAGVVIESGESAPAPVRKKPIEPAIKT